MAVTNRHGETLNFLLAICYMEDDLCDEVVRRCAPCSHQRFFSEYEEAYIRKYGSEWELSQTNPPCLW